MSAFARIGAAEARACLAEARALGITGTFSHRGAAGVALKVLIIANKNVSSEQNGITTEQRALILKIPTQTGFAKPTTDVEPITPGDSFTYMSRVHYAVNPIEKNVYGTVYKVMFVEDKRLDIK